MGLFTKGLSAWVQSGLKQQNRTESFALQQLDCVEFKMHRCIVLLKDKIVINDTIIASNIC